MSKTKHTLLAWTTITLSACISSHDDENQSTQQNMRKVEKIRSDSKDIDINEFWALEIPFSGELDEGENCQQLSQDSTIETSGEPGSDGYKYIKYQLEENSQGQLKWCAEPLIVYQKVIAEKEFQVEQVLYEQTLEFDYTEKNSRQAIRGEGVVEIQNEIQQKAIYNLEMQQKELPWEYDVKLNITLEFYGGEYVCEIEIHSEDSELDDGTLPPCDLKDKDGQVVLENFN